MNKLNKREFLKISAALGAGGAATPAAVPPSGDLLDVNFASTSGRHFGSQVIHHGEQAGFQVTPISQDKAAPGYQRPKGIKRVRKGIKRVST